MNPTAFEYNPKASMEDLLKQGHATGILDRKLRFGPDISGLQEMIMYGLKGRVPPLSWNSVR